MQGKGALLEVSDDSFDLKIADCVWERDLNNPNSFFQTGFFFGGCGFFFFWYGEEDDKAEAF